MNYLIAVTVQQIEARCTERQLYRVDREASLKSVVTAAVNRSELTGPVHCQKVEVLGHLESHLFHHYVDLLEDRDVTDLTEDV